VLVAVLIKGGFVAWREGGPLVDVVVVVVVTVVILSQWST
jgi:hypothetical protein